MPWGHLALTLAATSFFGQFMLQLALLACLGDLT
jgi:hypothetical protein